MKKRILLVVFSLLFLLALGIFYWQKQKRPPIESKFIQEVGQSVKDIEQSGIRQKENDSASVKINLKNPGDYALVPNNYHVYQTFNNCGPATLSMILAWNGINVSQKELADLMRPYQVANGDNDDKTIFTYEFVDWAEKYNLGAIGRVNGDLDLLKAFTANGIPVVVKTWLHVGEDIGHFRMIRGFDETKQVIIQDDSYEGPNKKIPYFDFLSMWQPFNYSYIIVYKPEQKDLVEAIIGLETDEKTNWQNALLKAQKESQLDQENVYPLFNQSASYYHLGDYQKSVEAFENIENKLPRRMLWYQIEPILSYYELKNYERVFEIIDKILQNGNRAYSELYQIRGEIYLQKGDKQAAKGEFEQALKYNKNFSPAQKALGVI